MKTQQVIQDFRDELLLALPASVTIRTVGGDGSAKPPVCLLDWTKRRIGENGANPYAGTERDSNGDATGRELHRYYQMEMDVTVRTYDEAKRDTWLSDVEDHFLPMEYDADAFHPDSFEWEVGDGEPRNNPAVEPDWYESGLMVRFKIVSRVTQPDDALGSVQEGVYVDESL